MQDQKTENWIKWIALTTAVMAVFAAVTTLYIGKYSSRAILDQGQETDQWAYYQAKSIKSHTYELQKQKLQIELLCQPALSKQATDKYREVLDIYDKTIKRYDKEKDEIKATAEALAKDKHLAQKRAGNFGYSLIFLQIGIMLSSIAALTKEKRLWYLGLVISAGWVFYFLDAIYLFY
ncbi:MAG: DUF4337 domain-containing protein [Syntrophales bacterium]